MAARGKSPLPRNAGDDGDSDDESDALLGRDSIYAHGSTDDKSAERPESTATGLQVFMSLLFTIYVPCFLFNLAGSITDPVRFSLFC